MKIHTQNMHQELILYQVNENLFAINRIKENLVLNKPIYVGMAILDLSKLFMYDFYYNYMLKKKIYIYIYMARKILNKC